jgi:hypothetical protein
MQWMLIGLLLVLSPWIVVAAAVQRRFGGYRNIAFGFDGASVKPHGFCQRCHALIDFRSRYPWYRMRRTHSSSPITVMARRRSPRISGGRVRLTICSQC